MAPPDPDQLRRERVLKHVDVEGRGLEVGPSYNPLIPKSLFANVSTLDHTDAASLRAKYREMSLPEDLLARIEEVDYLWHGGPLASAVPDGTTFDFIVGSHLIEHTVDLIGFLQDCQTLLVTGGRLALVVPDMRYCFDHWQSITSAGPVIDAHFRPTRFHPPGALLDHMLYATKKGDDLAWGPTDPRPLSLQFEDLSQVSTWYQIAAGQEEYFDIHRWRFTPTSLLLLLEDLAAMGYHSLRPVAPAVEMGFEFALTLSSDSDYRPPYDPGHRLDLLHRIDAEVSAAR